MGFIPKVRCRKCETQFSALLRRCPKCGTRKPNESSRTPAGTASAMSGTSSNSRADANAKWQFIFGIILLAVVIIAVMVLIVISTGDADPGETVPPSVSVDVVVPPETAAPVTTPTTAPNVSTITITFLNSEIEEFAASVGDLIQLGATVYPLDPAVQVEWSSSDPSVCTVDQTGMVTAAGSGWGEVTAKAGGVHATCRVWVKG